MRLLVDTQILIWAGQGSPRLSTAAVALLDDRANQLFFSPLSVAEVAIKHEKGRPDFTIEPALFRAMLLESGYEELPLTGNAAVRLGGLPPVHKDPFDRLLVAQALVEGIALVTADAVLGGYPGQVIVV